MKKDHLAIYRKIRTLVCKEYNVSMSMINKKKNHCRKPEFVYPRQVIEYCMVEFVGSGPEEICKLTGVDRSTVYNSHKIIGQDLKQLNPISDYFNTKSIVSDIEYLVKVAKSNTRILNRKKKLERIRKEYEKQVSLYRVELSKIIPEKLPEFKPLNEMTEVVINK